MQCKWKTVFVVVLFFTILPWTHRQIQICYACRGVQSTHIHTDRSKTKETSRRKTWTDEMMAMYFPLTINLQCCSYRLQQKHTSNEEIAIDTKIDTCTHTITYRLSLPLGPVLYISLFSHSIFLLYDCDEIQHFSYRPSVHSVFHSLTVFQFHFERTCAQMP